MQVHHKTLCGVVVSAGRMMKAVKVRTAKQVYNSFLKKHFQTYDSHLVSDSSNSVRAGDVVRIESGWHASKHIKHRVTEIVAPWGPPIDQRPKIPNDEELMGAKKAKRAAKLERRAQRRASGDVEGTSDAKESRPGGIKALIDVAK